MADEFVMADDSMDDAIIPAGQSAVISESEDADTCSNIALFTYEDITHDKIARSMREMFKGFSCDDNVDIAKEFKDIKQLAGYASKTLQDIQSVQNDGETVKIAHTSVALTRFWYLGRDIDNALKSASYGNGAVNQLAAAMKKSVPYVYQLRDVAKQLTEEDCFLLGMRGCTTTTLRRLAQIKDRDVAKQIIVAFINDTQDTTDVTRIERATRSFKTAINDACSKVNLLDQSTTNPEEVVDDPALLVNPSYAEAVKIVDDLERKLKKMTSEEYVCKVCDTLADFAVTESVPNAQQRLDEFKERIKEVQAMVKVVTEYLSDIDRELTSVSKVEVIK